MSCCEKRSTPSNENNLREKLLKMLNEKESTEKVEHTEENLESLIELCSKDDECDLRALIKEVVYETMSSIKDIKVNCPCYKTNEYYNDLRQLDMRGENVDVSADFILICLLLFVVLFFYFSKF